MRTVADVELVGVQKTLSPVLKAKALDNRLPAPILGDAYAEQTMRRLDPGYDKGRFGASQLGLAAGCEPKPSTTGPEASSPIIARRWC
jgi:O-methyltransferase involved in polyketide biosynthesis